MNISPLANYIRAREEYHAGHKEEALQLLTESMGLEKPTPIMRDALDKLVDLNDVALTLVLHEIIKGG